jgi:hypothetical protein
MASFRPIDAGGTRTDSVLVGGSHPGKRQNCCSELGSFVPSLAFAGSVQQNMQRVCDSLIATVLNEFP